MSDVALRVSVEQDTLGRFLNYLQVVGQARIIGELQVQREQIGYQIALQQAQLIALQQSNLIAEQLVGIEQKRLELELLKERRAENEREERAVEITRLKYLRNVLAEAIIELEELADNLGSDIPLFRPAALLQAKLKVLAEQKEGFTDHTEILAFYRAKKLFEELLFSHVSQLTSDPLEAIKKDLEKEKNLVNQLEKITTEAELRFKALSIPCSDQLNPEFMLDTIEWLAEKRDSLEKTLGKIRSQISFEYWNEKQGELQPDAKSLAHFLCNDELLRDDLKDLLDMSDLKGPEYVKLLNTLDSINSILQKKIVYFIHDNLKIGPVLLEHLDGLIENQTIFAFDLVWHHAVSDWYPLFILLPELILRGILPAPIFPQKPAIRDILPQPYLPPIKYTHFTNAVIERKLFYINNESEILGPFFLDQIDSLLQWKKFSESDLMWHNIALNWQPLSEVIIALEEQKILPAPSKLVCMERRVKSGSKWLAARAENYFSKIKNTIKS